MDVEPKKNLVGNVSIKEFNQLPLPTELTPEQTLQIMLESRQRSELEQIKVISADVKVKRQVLYCESLVESGLLQFVRHVPVLTKTGINEGFILYRLTDQGKKVQVEINERIKQNHPERNVEKKLGRPKKDISL